MADKFNLIGVVRGNATSTTKPSDAHPEGRPKAEVQIEDITGVKATWGTFKVSTAKDLELGKWYEFEVMTPPKKEGGGIWHNLEKVIRGPMEKPETGSRGEAAAMAATGPAHTVKTDAQFKIERTSLQRQGAMGIVVRLVEAGIALDDLGPAVATILEHAATVERFYERDVSEEAVPAKGSIGRVPRRKAEAKATLPSDAGEEAPAVEPPSDSKNGSATDEELEALGAPRFENAGALMMAVTSEFKGKTSGDLCKLVGVERPVDIEDYDGAYAKAKAAWGEAA